MQTNKALIVVDFQNDFLPGGALGVNEGQLAYRGLEQLMEEVDVIVFTRDWHPENHISFSDDPQYRDGSWPRHCVQNTEGAEIDPMLWSYALDTGKPVMLVDKGFDPNKEAYSGFDGVINRVFNDENKDDQLAGQELVDALLALNVIRVYIGGLALDYCVKATALDSVERFITVVYLDATRPVGYLTGAEAVAAMAYADILINSKEF